MSLSGYDIIGDVHGCANTLHKLLFKLGYKQEDNVYCHPSRQAIFVGDIIDRGPRIREALHIIKNMVDAGSAQCVMGNHEHYALGYVTPTPESKDSPEPAFVRAHNSRHNRMIAETLEQFDAYPEQWGMFLEWFRSLPVYLDFGCFRVVHACWDGKLIEEVEKAGLPARKDESFIQKSFQSHTFEGRVMRRLTRGTDIVLPQGRSITGKDGFQRNMFRTKFWADNPRTFRDVAFQPDPLPDDIANLAIETEHFESLLCYDESQPPVFVGHYWLEGRPEPLKPNVACLDYSAVKYGRLAAYRYDGETALSADKFVWVNVEPE